MFALIAPRIQPSDRCFRWPWCPRRSLFFHFMCKCNFYLLHFISWSRLSGVHHHTERKAMSLHRTTLQLAFLRERRHAEYSVAWSLKVCFSIGGHTWKPSWRRAFTYFTILFLSRFWKCSLETTVTTALMARSCCHPRTLLHVGALLLLFEYELALLSSGIIVLDGKKSWVGGTETHCWVSVDFFWLKIAVILLPCVRLFLSSFTDDTAPDGEIRL